MGFQNEYQEYRTRFERLDPKKFDDLPKATAKDQQTHNGKSLWREIDKTRGIFEFMPVKIGELDLWNPVIRVTARKTIVETPLVEREGSVKEIISLDDYIINIRGIIKNKTGLWPADEVKQLFDLWKQNKALPIQSALTAIALSGNENVVITNLSLPEQQGKVESVAYEIECVSDQAFSLEIE
jgi:hypothetical protein